MSTDQHIGSQSHAFSVRLELSLEERLRDHGKDVDRLESQTEKLRSRLEAIRHPLELNEILVRPANSKSGSMWRLWKGSTSRKTTSSGGVTRFIIQLARLTNNDLVAIVHFRSLNHDAYEQQLGRLLSGAYKEQRPAFVPLPDKSESTSELRRIRAPGKLIPPHQSGISESAGVSLALRREDVMHALTSKSSAIVQTPDGEVSIEFSDYNELHLSIPGSSTKPYRSYSASILESEEAWKLNRRAALTPEIDPCVILTDRERQFLTQFEEEKLPSMIDGSAGSGKTTLLSLTLAALVVNSHSRGHSQDNLPLFVTYSDRLRDVARKRLMASLVLQHNWSEKLATEKAMRVVRTLEQVVNDVIGRNLETDPHEPYEPRRSGDEWSRFSKWWKGRSGANAYIRGGESPSEIFRILRLLVFGYLPVDRSANNYERQELEERRRSTERVHDVTAEDLNRALVTWESYRSHLLRSGKNSDTIALTTADRTRYAADLVMQNPAAHGCWGHIIADEAQDLSEHDLRFLCCLSRFSSRGIEVDRDMNHKAFSLALPLILAGDEMQSVSPSGFTFAGCQQLLEQITNDMGFHVATPPNVFRLDDNFRNLERIARLSTATRRLLSAQSRNKHVTEPRIHRHAEGPGLVGQIVHNDSIDSSIGSFLNLSSVAVVLPCRSEELEAYIKSPEFRAVIGDAHIVNPSTFLTVEECKGLEYPVVLILDFASAYERYSRDGQLTWFLNALTVAVSRARDRVFFLDKASAPTQLWTDLKSKGGPELSKLQGFEVIITDNEKAQTLVSRMRALATNSDTNQAKSETLNLLYLFYSEGVELLSRDNLTVPARSALATAVAAHKTWSGFLERSKVDDWTSLVGYEDGCLWERVIDEAVQDNCCEALVNLFPPSHTTGLEVERRLFTAACTLAINDTSFGDVPARVSRLAQQLEGFPSALTEGWIASLGNESALAKLLWSKVRQMIKRHAGAWTDTATAESVELLKLIDPSDWTAGLLEVKRSLNDLGRAREKLLMWRDRLPDDEYSDLEFDIVFTCHGLSWIDTNEARDDVLNAFRTAENLDKGLMNVMKLESVNSCAGRNLAHLLQVSKDAELGKGNGATRSQLLAMAAANAVIEREFAEIETTLSTIHSSMTTASNQEGGK